MIKYYVFSLRERIDLKALLTFVISGILYFIGQPTAGIYAFIVICVLDLVLGAGLAASRKEFNIRRFLRGLGKLVVYGLALGAANMMDVVIADVINFMKDLNLHMVLFKYLMILYLAVHEFMSLLGKFNLMGVKIPKRLLKILDEYKDILDGSLEKKKID